jgi:glycosyltransferase involved in cell wall biosynthesis
MKVAIYTIALNEEQFVDKWYDSCRDADYWLIMDTGSTDDTVSNALLRGIDVQSISVKPWRFDKARNAALNALPKDIDYCIALDMDEVLLPGWRDELQKMHDLGITRPRYKYIWSWNEDGSEGLVYGGDKIHTRNYYEWKHPVHEVVKCVGTEKQEWCDIEIHHYPDSSKSRGQYLPLLKLSVEENPLDDRNAHYYARELLMYGDKDDAFKEFERHLALPTATWNAERANSYRYMSMCVDDDSLKEELLFKCVAEYPYGREGWVMLGQYYYLKEDWHGCYFAISKALEITDKPLVYFNETWAWNEYPYDIGSLAAFYLGQDKDAILWCEKAIELAPDNDRIKNNLLQFKEVSSGDN